MPKVSKVSKATAARTAAHPTATKSASSKKKKKGSGIASHAASLGEDLEKLANPGKLKPVKASAAVAKPDKALGKEEQKLENQILLAGKTSSAAGKKKAAKDARQLYGAGDAAPMEDEGDAAGADEDAEEPDFGEDEDEGEDDGALISARMSKKILQQVHKQQREVEGEEGVEEEQGAKSSASRLKQHVSLRPAVADDEDDDEEDGGDDDEDDFDLDESTGRSGQRAAEVDEEVELSMEDAEALNMFMPHAASTKAKSLADSIMDKIREKEAAAAGNGSGQQSHGSNVRFGPGFGSVSEAFGLPPPGAAADAAIRSKLDPKIVDVYTKVGKFLSHYTSGKVPKAFKLVPNLRAWEEVLFLTQPENWTAQAHLVATRIFASNLNPRMAQRFYALVLLPKVRQDIESNKHLNFHLYQAIKKALYKPAAFFKGLLLPLAEEGATARESVIMASILSKCTIPVLHASVALLKLTQMPFSGTSALFIRTILNKKYSLPRKVLAACTQFFCSFLHQSPGGVAPGMGACPLIWHQTLLAFVQRYKFELSPNQIQALRNLVKVQQHHAVTAEIRREMMAVQEREKAMAGGASSNNWQFGAKHLQAALQGSVPTPAFTSLAASLQNPETFSMES